MTPMTSLSAAAVLALCTPAAVMADGDDFLTIGDAAPALDISHWVKGKPIGSFEDDKVYVVEFWATWCGPCIAAMPHMSELQERYADYGVSFIGVSDEDLSTVVSFLCKQNKRDNLLNHDRVGYTLTTDPDKSVKNDYFTAAGRSGIPCAFIVGKDQHIEWIGHPMGMDDALDKVVHDNWDRKAFHKEYETAQKPAREMAKRRRAMQGAYEAKDWDKLVGILDQAIEDTGQPEYYVNKFTILAKDVKDYDRAYAVVDQVLEVAWDKPYVLNQVAWFIADEKGLEERDLVRALKAADRANELTEHSDGAILDTVARIHLEMALRYQRQAVENAEGRMKDSLAETLDQYERALKKEDH